MGDAPKSLGKWSTINHQIWGRKVPYFQPNPVGSLVGTGGNTRGNIAQTRCLSHSQNGDNCRICIKVDSHQSGSLNPNQRKSKQIKWSNWSSWSGTVTLSWPSLCHRKNWQRDFTCFDPHVISTFLKHLLLQKSTSHPSLQVISDSLLVLCQDRPSRWPPFAPTSGHGTLAAPGTQPRRPESPGPGPSSAAGAS